MEAIEGVMSRNLKAVIALMLFLTPLQGFAKLAAEEVEFFEKKIRPVLIDNCYACHNSVDKAKGGLALDYKAALREGGDSGEVIVAGKPGESLLIQSIRHEGGMKMPFKSPKLDDAVIRDFEKWVKMGAPDPRLVKPLKGDPKAGLPWEQVRDQRALWWAFQPLRQTPVPKVDSPAWSANPIDRFVFDRMKREGLSPQPEALDGVLVRRVHLVLTGLPPTPEAVKAFEEDASPDAYEKLVDRLLASKAFGERWARHWMDWYRYAETHGSEGDPPIPYAKQYRDYLIRALNADVPYDQLLREHLAGDLLEDPRINHERQLNESAIGPAHLRMVPHGFGVTDAYGEQITFTDNQIDVVSKAMLGVTVSCARCHDHKFDPISQKDFYRFYGVMVSGRASTVLVDTKQKLETNKEAIVKLKREMRRGFAEHWLSQVDALPAWLETNPEVIAGQKRFNDPLGAWHLFKDAEPKAYADLIKQQLEQVDKLKADNAQAVKDAGYYLDLRDPDNADKWATTGNSSADRVSPAGSFALHAQGDRVIRGIYPSGIYTHLISDKHAAVFSTTNYKAAGKQSVVRVAGANAQLRAPIRNYPLSNGLLHPPNALKNESFRWQTATRKWTYWQGEQLHYEMRTSRDTIPRPGGSDRSWFGVTEIYAGERPPQPEGAPLVSLVKNTGAITDRASLAKAYRDALRAAIVAWRDGQMTDAQALFLDAFIGSGFLANTIDPLAKPLKQQFARYRELEKAIPVPTRAPGVMDAESIDQPLLVRGDYKQQAEPVKRQFLELFSSKPYETSGSGRLELAQDMVSDANTLKSRVLINRLWAYVYGRGIVASTDNFGRLGKQPTHPELLDHLALDFEKNSWSIKHALRRMVTSRAFRSVGQADSPVREKDPLNIYLSHFTARRLDAEAIYDSVQHVAGRPDRAIYKPVIRNRLDPFMATFNRPVPTSTVSSRNSTNVPAQSLAMMNGKIVEDAARAWAQRIERDKQLATSEQKIKAMFEQAYARPPSKQEAQLLLAYLNKKPADPLVRTGHAQDHQRMEQELEAIRTSRDELLAPVRGRLQREVDRRNAQKQKEQVGKAVDLKPIARWDFEGDAKDAVGTLHGELKGKAKIDNGALALNGGYMATGPIAQGLGAKTLEVLVQLDRLDQRGGGAMTVQSLDGNVFDSIVFAEKGAGHWLAGSDHHRRTKAFAGPIERDAAKRPVRIIIVYHADGTITGYRDGKPYGKPYRSNALVKHEPSKTQVVFGLRHGIATTNGRMLTGKIYEAWLYDRALTAEEAAAASTGQLKAIVTPQMLLDALSPDQRKAIGEIDTKLAKIKRVVAELDGKVQAERKQAKIPGGGYFGIAHAILNSKEFIYVY